MGKISGEMKTDNELKEAFETFLRSRYDLGLDDVEPADEKGYWNVKGGCKGGSQCKHAFAVAMGPCDGGERLTIYFSEFGIRNPRGLWMDPYRTWKRLKALS